MTPLAARPPAAGFLLASFARRAVAKADANCEQWTPRQLGGGAMLEKLSGPERLLAFSDGMFAVIITIMVLDLKVPHSPEPAALIEQWPTFLAYALSFVQAGIYWVNHHALFKPAEKVDDRILWLNLLILFALSLMPFATAFLAETAAAPFPTAVYAFVMLLPALVFNSLHRAILQVNPGDEQIGQAALTKGLIAIGLYVCAVAVALASPALSLLLVFTVAVMYFVPIRYA